MRAQVPVQGFWILVGDRLGRAGLAQAVLGIEERTWHNRMPRRGIISSKTLHQNISIIHVKIRFRPGCIHACCKQKKNGRWVATHVLHTLHRLLTSLINSATVYLYKAIPIIHILSCYDRQHFAVSLDYSILPEYRVVHTLQYYAGWRYAALHVRTWDSSPTRHL